jgi:hypothetical protein
MPVGTTERKTYLHIGLGKLRQKVTEGVKDAQSRVNKENKTVWELVYDWIEGTIVSIYHKESEDFGNSFEVTLFDGHDKFQVSFAEDSNFFSDFFSKLPNIDLSKPVKIAPYDFEDKQAQKRRKGVTVMQEGAKIENYFVSRGEGGFEYCNGFPQPENPKKMDKEDWKIYFIKVKKFLRQYTKDSIIPKLQNAILNEAANTANVPDEPEVNVEENDDLPF